MYHAGGFSYFLHPQPLGAAFAGFFAALAGFFAVLFAAAMCSLLLNVACYLVRQRTP